MEAATAVGSKTAERYLRYLKAGNRSATTIYDYGRTFTRFFEQYDSLNTDNVEAFLESLAPSTRNKYRIQLSGLAKFSKTDNVDWDMIPAPKLSKEPPKIMRPEHSTTIYRWLMTYDRRNKTVFGVVYRFIMHTALRISELTSVAPDSIDYDRNGMPFLVVNKGNGGTSHSKDGRIVPLDRAARRIIDNYSLPFDVSERHFNRLLHQACRESRLRTTYSAHNLRKTCLSRWHDQGMDIRTIADLAGHSSTDTLIHYLDRSPEALRRKMNKAVIRR